MVENYIDKVPLMNLTMLAECMWRMFIPLDEVWQLQLLFSEIRPKHTRQDESINLRHLSFLQIGTLTCYESACPSCTWL